MNQKTFLITTVLMTLLILLTACLNPKKNNEQSDDQKEIILPNPIQNDTIRRCHTMQVLEKHLVKTPDLRSKMESIEKRCQAFVALRATGKMQDLDTVTIPTIVHVLYSNDTENIDDSQIQSQIEILNLDFSKTNKDIDQIPEEFAPFSSDTKIRFVIDSIIRVATTRTSWGTDDQMKFSSNGGSNVVEPETHLNIWICNIGQGILGYAQFPGDSATTDGIVISPQYFGNTGSVQAPFDKGRTTTHEVGHWLNLRHIWGDGNCSADDFVADTPASDTPNYGCPSYPLTHCESNDMTMNYMDYVDDGCMYMFTDGQMERMRAVFIEKGGREGFIKI